MMASKPIWTIEPYHVWRHVSGRRVSAYGALPYGEGWEHVTEGYTLRNTRDNTVGCYGLSLIDRTDLEAVKALRDKLNALHTGNAA